MTVAYNDRTLPLAAHASNPDLTTGLNIGWDFTGFDASHADGVPWVSPAAATMTKTGTIDAATRNGMPGRFMHNANSWYKKTGTTGLNVMTGTGDFTVSMLVSMPAAAPTVSEIVGHIFALYGTSGQGVSLDFGNVAGTGSYVSLLVYGATVVSTSATYYLLPGRAYVLTIKRTGNTFSLHQYDLSNGTYKLQGSGTATGTLDATRAADIYFGWATTSNADAVLHALTHWTTAIPDATIQTKLGADYWSMNANSAGASTISVTTPATGATIGSTATITGISAGTAPTGVEVQFNGSAWTALSSFSYNAGDGSWTGTVTGLTAGTGTFQARKANETATVSSVINGVIVSSDSITLANVPAYRIFQRNVATNNANIALSGAYVGVVTSIEWRLGSGAWSALTGATIAGGNWSGTASNVPTGSGALQVRFGNNTAVMASIAGVGVGDVWICGGQSNMQGRGTTANSYTPSGGLTASKYNAGTWADLTDPYDTASSGAGSYIPLLASKMLAAGVPVAFVGCAVGGTDIISWQKGGGNYNNMLAKFNAIGAARGLLWHQGESDVLNGMSTATYVGYLNTMIDNWFTDTGLKTVVFRIHEGGPGTVQQHNDIREAQTLVGTNNTHAVLGPDTYGIEATDVHFLTTAKLQQVVDRAWPCIASEFYGMRKVSLPLVSKAGAARANLRGIKYAFFDQVTPDSFAAPTASGGAIGLGAVSDANGQIKIPLPNTTKSAGQTGFLILTDSDGNVATAHQAFAGPVTLS